MEETQTLKIIIIKIYIDVTFFVPLITKRFTECPCRTVVNIIYVEKKLFLSITSPMSDQLGAQPTQTFIIVYTILIMK